jgi:Glycerophosphoryl diester phosphodiesterase family
VPASQVGISAHAGDRTATIETFRNAVATGADYVELDIRRTADGELVSFHDALAPGGEPLSAVGHARLCDLAGYLVPTVADVLATIKGHARGHLDLKDTGGEAEVVRLALDVLGPGQFIITTLEDSSAAAIRSRFPAPTTCRSRSPSAATWRARHRRDGCGMGDPSIPAAPGYAAARVDVGHQATSCTTARTCAFPCVTSHTRVPSARQPAPCGLSPAREPARARLAAMSTAGSRS